MIATQSREIIIHEQYNPLTIRRARIHSCSSKCIREVCKVHSTIVYLGLRTLVMSRVLFICEGHLVVSLLSCVRPPDHHWRPHPIGDDISLYLLCFLFGDLGHAKETTDYTRWEIYSRLVESKYVQKVGNLYMVQ
jgi:hypothetical protein